MQKCHSGYGKKTTILKTGGASQKDIVIIRFLSTRLFFIF